MNLFLEILQVIGTVLYQILSATVRLFIPGKAKDVDGEIVLITGAGSGLGRLLSIQFASLGSTVVCCDINEEANDKTVETIKSMRGDACGYVFDCSDRKEVYDVAEKIKTEVGDVSILVNNAGIVSGKKFMDTPDALIQKSFEVNTISHFWTTKAFLPSMLEKNHGHVVSIASAAGLAGVNGLCDYCASKFGAVGFQEALHLELKAQNKTGVHTTVVCPFYINTGMFDGVKSRFPLLLPIMDPDWVTGKIIDGILHNQERIILPKIIGLAAILKCILPYSSFVTMSNFFGFTSSMDDFSGRSKQD